jgi:hypothetical protein
MVHPPIRATLGKNTLLTHRKLYAKHGFSPRFAENRSFLKCIAARGRQAKQKRLDRRDAVMKAIFDALDRQIRVL